MANTEMILPSPSAQANSFSQHPQPIPRRAIDIMSPKHYSLVSNLSHQSVSSLQSVSDVAKRRQKRRSRSRKSIQEKVIQRKETEELAALERWGTGMQDKVDTTVGRDLSRQVKQDKELRRLSRFAKRQNPLLSQFLKALMSDDSETMEAVLKVSKENEKTKNIDSLYCLESETKEVDVNGTLPMNDKMETSITYLHFAAWFGYESAVSVLYIHGAKVNKRTKGRGFTALHFATMGNHVRICDFLVRNGALINPIGCVYGTTPIELAVSLQAPQMVDALLQHNALKLSQLSEEKENAIETKFLGRNDFGVEELIYMGQHDSRGIPLIILSYINQGYRLDLLTEHMLTNYSYSLEATRRLKEYGIHFNPNAVDINEEDVYGLTLFDHAARFGDLMALIRLTKLGARSGNPNVLFRLATTVYSDNKHKDPLFCLILCLKNLKLNGQLQEGGSTATGYSFLDDETGMSPLHCLCSLDYEQNGRASLHRSSSMQPSHLQTINLEIAHFFQDFDLLSRTRKGGKAMDSFKLYACLAEYFIYTLQIDINGKTVANDTALHYASKYGLEDLVEVLLINGALVDEFNDEGWLPIHLAVKGCNVRCVQLFTQTLEFYHFKDFCDAKSRGAGFHPVVIQNYLNRRSQNEQRVTPLINACALTPITASEVDYELLEDEKDLVLRKNIHKIVTLLVDHNHRILKSCDHTKLNCLHAAAQHNNVAAMKLLLKRLKNNYTFFDYTENCVRFSDILNRHDTSNGYTALHYAAEKGHYDICRILVLFNANPRLIDVNHHRPIDLAMLNGKSRVVKLLGEFCELDPTIRSPSQRKLRTRNHRRTKQGTSPKKLKGKEIRHLKRAIKQSMAPDVDNFEVVI